MWTGDVIPSSHCHKYCMHWYLSNLHCMVRWRVYVMAMLCDHCMANLNLFSHPHSHVHDHSVASCDAIPQAPTSFTPDAATVPCFIVGAAVGCLLLLSMFLTIATAAINNYTSISKFLYTGTRHLPAPIPLSPPARRRTRPILGTGSPTSIYSKLRPGARPHPPRCSAFHCWDKTCLLLKAWVFT